MAEAAKKKKQVTRKPSAVKRARQSIKRHERNRGLLTQMRTQVKRFRVALVAKNTKDATALLVPTLSIIAKMARHGILHRNTAARYTSRLQTQFNTLAA